MTLEKIKELLENKIRNLETRLETARQIGNLEEYMILEEDLNETKIALDKINRSI